MNTIYSAHEQILSQIRALHADLQSPAMPAATASPEVKGPGFGELLQNSLASVSKTQATAQQMAIDYENGTGDASLVEVMVSLTEADLSFRAVTEVRNKLVAAYQEIMNMPV
jgi:flagellar hook-basal body complex protein FliE